MSNDNKTLADVQPGGRVRLATVPYDRARDLIGDAYNAGTHGIGYSQQAMELHDAIIPVQPTPGGQDALHEAARRVISDIDSGDYSGTISMATYDALVAALAARQPVGSIPEWFELVIRDVCELDPEDPDAADTVCIRMLDLRLIMERHAPPAQAVDLDAMRALLQRRIEQWRSHLPADPCAPGTREIETKGEHDYNNDARIYREGIAVMEELLSKIDNQAVGNG
ncbi:hypothetical protein [Stenotrophomonas sp. AS012628]|uniref:hypothetical protein n=1 Tax=Stenotrophomonas sp. AS012628 TaxID=2597656 RepID=UPI0017828CB0|nr:hypothetical protein [Stenotrophomonas sp. AS012628]